MKEKTALQQVYGLLDEGCIGQVLKDRAEFLELEKKQVMDAYERGVNVAGFALQGDVFIAKEQYFTDTYEQGK